MGRVDLAFTDAELDLAANDTHPVLASAFDVEHVQAMSQVHGARVVTIDGATTAPECDGLVSTAAGVALLVRVADCVPVLLADPAAGVVAAAHAGRVGMAGGVVPATVHRMREHGARSISAWLGPRACPRCYELPEQMVAEVDSVEPGIRSTTSSGTASIDVGKGVVQQLEREGVEVDDVGAGVCTIECDDLFSYRRQGHAAGRFGGVVVLR